MKRKMEELKENLQSWFEEVEGRKINGEKVGFGYSLGIDSNIMNPYILIGFNTTFQKKVEEIGLNIISNFFKFKNPEFKYDKAGYLKVEFESIRENNNNILSLKALPLVGSLFSEYKYHSIKICAHTK